DCGSLNYHSEGEHQIPSVFAKNPSITTGGGKVTVVWSERDDSFNPPKYQIRRKTLNGATWEFNGTLSANDAHWPVIVSSGNTRYIAWTEKDPVSGTLQLHVAKQ
ncbi:MAG TPA: hypothetical protein VFA47_02075, partial [Candidatus Manganitrophaceae bacterium]|nr:hypothetical protein [Candidatus Manganitrophaceae bacterium]